MTKVFATLLALVVAVPLLAGVAAAQQETPTTPPASPAWGYAPWCPWVQQPLGEQERAYLQKSWEIRARLRQAQRDLWAARTTETDPAKLQEREREVSRLQAELNQLDRDNPQAAARLRAGLGYGPGFGAWGPGQPGAGYGPGAGRRLGFRYGAGPGEMWGYGRGAARRFGRGYGPGPGSGTRAGLGIGPCGGGMAWRFGPGGGGRWR